jgi:hypothetical protein
LGSVDHGVGRRAISIYNDTTTAFTTSISSGFAVLGGHDVRDRDPAAAGECDGECPDRSGLIDHQRRAFACAVEKPLDRLLVVAHAVVKRSSPLLASITVA